ncbi:MAG TPA: glutathione S-transferase family protein [Methylomirabilota bacterium]|nr:glutathione S-transferase family protein [Methylomirabilota bacterium]
MRRLYHFCLQPASRKLRILLREKGLEFELQAENAWEKRAAFLALNHAGEVPVLVEDDGTVIADGTAVAEYVEEVYPTPSLLGTTPAARAEVRRLVGWFDAKFNREVTANLFDQKILRRLNGHGGPDSQAIRNGNANIHTHLEYIAWLADRRKWLGGDEFSLADIAAAAHLSAIDYIGDIPWDRHPGAKDWYARVKSRPSFRPLLADQLPGIAPPPHYADLDF